MSRSMNTVHRSLDSGEGMPSVLCEYSSRGQFIRFACSSRKLPVPAAQTVFMTEKVTRPLFRVVNFESCPPISMIVSTSGFSAAAAFAWADISSTTVSAPMIFPISFLPEPVVPEPRTARLRP
ncbi:MAG: hypothetical protein BWZ01_03010 [Deltaproteobacteria bacterium ADurb.BinA179]|nr:MAG: hypothetical protein BWZ01_03010 [Deltaproteobacteria bacterium ADurb.BinA179]